MRWLINVEKCVMMVAFGFLLHRFWSSYLRWYHLWMDTWKMGYKSQNLLLSNWISYNLELGCIWSVMSWNLELNCLVLIMHLEDVVLMPSGASWFGVKFSAFCGFCFYCGWCGSWICSVPHLKTVVQVLSNMESSQLSALSRTHPLQQV